MPQFLILKRQYKQLLVFLGAPHQTVEQSYLDVLHCNVTERDRGKVLPCPTLPQLLFLQVPICRFAKRECTQPVPSASPWIPCCAWLCFEVSQSSITLCGRDRTVLARTSSNFLSLIIWVGSASSYIAGALPTPSGWGLRSVALHFSHHGTFYRKRKGLERRWSLPEGRVHNCRTRFSGIKDHYQILGKPMDAVSWDKREWDRGGPCFNTGPKEWIIRNY